MVRGSTALLLAIVLSCGGSVTGAKTTAPGTTAAVETTNPTTTSTTLVAATTTISVAPLGLITTTGVPVAFLRATLAGHIVLTPCGNEVLLRDGAPLGKTTVLIDPGHGGPVDTGAVAPTGLPEKQLNLKVAEAVQVALADWGIVAVLTRTADYSSPLYVRANLADTLGADLMVSIHHNAPNPPASADPGIEVFVQNCSPQSERLGGLLWEYSMDALGEFEVDWVAADDAGVMTVLNSRGDDAYGIIRHPETTTVLIELGYMSNSAEAELHEDPNYSKAVGAALAAAIDLYLTTEERGTGFVEGRIFDPRPGIARDACIDPEMGN